MISHTDSLVRWAPTGVSSKVLKTCKRAKFKCNAIHLPMPFTCMTEADSGHSGKVYLEPRNRCHEQEGFQKSRQSEYCAQGQESKSDAPRPNTSHAANIWVCLVPLAKIYIQEVYNSRLVSEELFSLPSGPPATAKQATGFPIPAFPTNGEEHTQARIIKVIAHQELHLKSIHLSF